MRMRKKKHGAERIEACSALLIRDISALKEGFAGVFDAERPVHLEIGCGKGNFAVGMAQKYPEVNFLAMERVSDVCCVALEKAMAAKEERSGDNLRFLIGDAKLLAENVKPHSLDCIYLNFSDPWPKAGHAKRRLTHRSFLDIYRIYSRRTGSCGSRPTMWGCLTSAWRSLPSTARSSCGRPAISTTARKTGIT